MDWSSIATYLITSGAVTTFGGWLIHRNVNRKMEKMQVKKTEVELYDDLHDTVKEQGVTIKGLNHALDDKTAQIRKLTDRVWQAERDLNIANEKVTSLTADNGNLLLKVEKYKNWHCRNAGCNGRIPPNPSLAGKTWDNAQTTEEAEEIININVNGK